MSVSPPMSQVSDPTVDSRYPLPFGAWTPLRAAVAAVVSGVAIMLALPSMLAGTIAWPTQEALGIDPSDLLAGPVAAVIEKTTLVVVAVVMLAALGRPLIRGHFGLGGGRWVRVIAAGVLGAVAINVAVRLYEAAAGGAQGASIGTQLVQQGLGSSVAADLCLILAICVLGPLGEEYLFRAVFHKGARDALRRFVPAWLAVALASTASSFLFMQIHLDPEQVGYWPVYLFFGLVCAAAYELTGSLAAPILAHVLNNTWAFWGGLRGGDADLAAPWMYVVLALAPVIAVALSLLIGSTLRGRRGQEARRLTA